MAQNSDLARLSGGLRKRSDLKKALIFDAQILTSNVNFAVP